MPNRFTYYSLFTGAGLADAGARAAGMLVKGGVEIEPAYAAIAHLNGFTDVRVADVRDIDFAAERAAKTIKRPTWLHASPSCQRASCSNPNAGQTKLDIELGEATARAITALEPGYVSIENVIGYREFFDCLAPIYRALGKYSIISGCLMASDYGVPQARKRWFLLASKHRVPTFPTVSYTNPSWNVAVRDLPRPERYKLSERMRAMIINKKFDGPVLAAGWNQYTGRERSGLTIIERGQPAMTVIKKMTQPSMRPHIVFKDNPTHTYPLTLEMMAALQSAPPDYQFRAPSNKSDVPAFEAIGNGVPSLLMQKIIEANLPL